MALDQSFRFEDLLTDNRLPQISSLFFVGIPMVSAIPQSY